MNTVSICYDNGTMLSLLFANPIIFIIAFPGLILAITIHEYAHAWMADRLGDPTPRYQDRLTLNPLAHLDPLGTLAILLTRFGWGKPVQFDPYNLKEPIRDTALIALAGPASNMIMASGLALVTRLPGLSPSVVVALGIVISINVVLALFNLVPVHPLDGSKIILPLLPRETAFEYEEFMKKYGIFLLIVLIMPWNGVSPISQLLDRPITFILQLLLG